MPLYRLDLEPGHDGAASSAFPAFRTLAHALGLAPGTLTPLLPRLAVGWPAFVEIDRWDEAALRALGLRAVAVASLPPAVTAPPSRLAWGPLRETLEGLAPEALATLRPPAFAIDVAAVEQALGCALPADFLAWLALHDGGHGSKSPFDWELRPLVSAERTRRMNNEIHADTDVAVEADVRVASTWWHPRWFPFAENGSGDALCLDFAPARFGTVGQVIEFRHDDTRRPWLAPSFADWVRRVADDVHEGRLVATENGGEFFGMVPRSSLTGSLATLRVRGESVAECEERVEREVLGNPGELARQVVARLVNKKKLAVAWGPRQLELRQAVAEAIEAARTRAERPGAILGVLRGSPAVESVVATEADVAAAILASAG